MLYLGANDQRVTLVDEGGHEVYTTDFRNFTLLLTHLRPLIRAMAIANPVGEVDKNLLKVFEGQMSREKDFHSITALSMTLADSRFLALVALAKAQTEKKTSGKKEAKKPGAKGNKSKR
jgi:hypothetical protein